MAQLTISDELDRRVRAQVGDDDAEVARYVESLIEGRLAAEEDPAWQAEVLEKIKQGMADVEAGRTYTSEEAREYLRERMKVLRSQ